LGRRRPTWLVTLAGVFTLLHAAVAASADLRFIEVNRDDDLYTLRSVSWFAAAPESLYDVLTDYDQFLKFSSAIVESRNLSPDDKGRPEYYTRMEGCLLFWCQSFVRIGHLNLKPEYEITAITDPERSNFKRARERWQLRAEDGGTLLIYEFEMIPDFWVPPVLGPFYIKRALKSGGANAVNRIEALALGEEPLP
jgi:hypothetical protein